MAITLGQRIRIALRALVNPQGAYGMFAGVFPFGGQPPRRGTAELLQAYANMPWLQAAVRKVSWAVATATFELYVARGQNGKAVKATALQRAGYRDRRKMIAAGLKQGTVQQLESHPLLDLLNDANPLMVGSTPRQLTQAWLDLAGEAYWLKERNGAGMPIALWPLPPTWVVEKATPVNPYYRVRFRGWQGEIPATEIVAFEDPDPADPYGRGVGVARALADELDTDEYAAKHTKTWFYNRARPDLLIAVEGLRPEDTARLEQDWLNRNQGFWRAYKPYFLNRKVDVIPLSQTFENMQLVDLRKFERDTIVQVFGVPPEVLGIIENSNRATIETADYLFARWVLMPRLEFFRQVIQERLVPDFDERLIVDYASPVSEDREYQLNAARTATWALTVDEWREMAGLEPLPDGRGQVFMIPYTLFPARSPGSEQPPAEPAPAASEAAVAGSPRKALDPELIRLLVEAVSEDRLRERMDPVYAEVVRVFGEELLQLVGAGIDFDLHNPRVVQFLQAECATKVSRINQTTREALRKTLAEGYEQGESIPKLAKRVSDVFADAKGRRAVVIARTEVLGASNFGAWEGMKQAGVPEKEWLATRDDRVRDSHLAADGQIQPVDKPFVLGSGVETMYPGGSGVPEEDIQCRCAVAPVVGGKTMLDTEEKRLAAWRKYDADLRPWERRMETAVKKAFQEQQDAVMELLKELGRED